jgi:hypothetical protein
LKQIENQDKTRYLITNFLLGDKGNKGLPGDHGVPGEKGVSGTPGEQGAQGETGSPGPAGLRGVNGDNGKPGAKGPQGWYLFINSVYYVKND